MAKNKQNIVSAAITAGLYKFADTLGAEDQIPDDSDYKKRKAAESKLEAAVAILRKNGMTEEQIKAALGG